MKQLVGILLLFTNQLVGWAGVLLCAHLARKTKKNIFYASGTAIYALSWVMLGVGAILVGPEQINMVRNAMVAHQWATLSIFAVVLTGALWYAIRKKKKTRAAVDQA